MSVKPVAVLLYRDCSAKASRRRNLPVRFIFSFLALTAWFFPKLRGKRAQGKQPVRENNRDLPQPIRNLAFLQLGQQFS